VIGVQENVLSKSIAAFGARPALGRAVAQRYAREGHRIVLVARQAARAADVSVPEMPTADPDHLADLLWTMHSTKSRPEATYPERLFNH
jgi:NAD(P)-dependent dehydrogenase (short-subunit alcohol dehydrogenase family)